MGIPRCYWGIQKDAVGSQFLVFIDSDAPPDKPESFTLQANHMFKIIRNLLLSLVALLVIGVVSVWAPDRPVEELTPRWAGAFVAGGGGGNLMDRVHIDAVVDFLDFHWRNIHWPAFNLADVFIVCAALIWSLVSLKAPPRQPTRKTPEELPS